jgi:AAA family ATP:ADP antiporter
MKNQVNSERPDPRLECAHRHPALRTAGARSLFLFTNFFLIITTLYQLKPASKSLFIESLGASFLPYVMIGTAVTMILFITWYHKMVARYSRLNIVMGSCLVFSGLLMVFRILLNQPGPAVPFAFYIFVDILGVVLVEQFWSLTNSIYTTMEGRSWYGVVGTGGLVGGVAGGAISAALIKFTPVQTPDLLLTAAGTILLILLLTWLMARAGIFCEVDHGTLSTQSVSAGSWRILGHSRYLALIAGILLLTQFASPIVDYQFMNAVEAAYPDQEARTAYISMFFSILGLVSIGINLGVTSLVHRCLGTIVGLMVQPLLMLLCAWGFMLNSTLTLGSAAKISDRALSYSINRASKELLYVPVDSVLIYQAKAWIDMFGYRLFKVTGSLLILLFTGWLPVTLSVGQLSWFVIVICLLWLGLIAMLRGEYDDACQRAGADA